MPKLPIYGMLKKFQWHQTKYKKLNHILQEF